MPLTSNLELFKALCPLGENLVKMHLMKTKPALITKYPEPGDHLVKKPYYDDNSRRVYINSTQYFEGVPPEIWNFHVGGYQVCQRWLRDRKGRNLSFDDLKHYQMIVATLKETILLMESIDSVIDDHGGWPIV